MKYYMSLDTLVEIEAESGESESAIFQKAKQKFLEILQSSTPIEIICVDTDE